MSKAQAARTFSVSLSSVNVALRREGSSRRIAEPQEEPRICSEARREGQEALGAGPQGAPLCHPPRALRLRRCHDGDLREPIHHVPRHHSQDWPHQEKRGRVSHRTRRVVRAGGLEGDGGRDGGGPETRLRGRVRGAYLPGTDLRIRSERPSAASVGTQKPGQEHDAAFEHDHGRDGTVANGGRGDYRPGIRDLRREGALAEPRAGADTW
jgi:hypothetical protein